MQTIKAAIFASTVAAAALSLGGCATKDFVSEQVATEDAKVQATQGQVDSA